jgi:hypothetical protein
MKPKTRPVLVLVLATTLFAEGTLRAQTPAPGPDLAGTWTGRAALTNDWPGFTCRYEGAEDPPAVRLELGREGEQWTGSVALDLPAAEGSGCPPLHKRYAVPAAHVTEGALTFTDSGGNEWNLALRRGEGMLKGLLAWKTGDESLAAGWKTPAGATPLTRLSGEVKLQRKAATAEGAGGAAEGAASEKASGGSRAGSIAAILAVNVVAAGAIYGVNKLGKSSSTSGVVTCSPRNCIVANPGEPCLCNANVLSGAPCGSTPSGAPQQAPCNATDTPCQAGLSCNGGICQDRFGFCPY